MRPTSPTGRLLIGFAITLLLVAVFSWYALRQIHGVRELQAETVERNRKDSLQLLRIQNNLHSLALAMRDMVEGGEPYPLIAWKGQFDRIRFDLDDAIRIENQLASSGQPEARDPERERRLADSLRQFWNSTDRMFEMARDGREEQARRLIRTSLEAQQAALTSTVARLLILNNESEQQAVSQIQRIFDRVERNVYVFIAAMLAAISVTSLYLIQANRRIFRRIEGLSDQHRILARKLITVQEEILHSVSRELHDEFGQILTAVGAMLGRAGKRLPPDSPFSAELAEVRSIAQETLDKMRSLSQIFHPAMLDDYGLEKTLEWYVQHFEKQTGIVIRYEKRGTGPRTNDETAIHVYRILQEALNNVARHSKSTEARVAFERNAARLRLEVEDHGVGFKPGPAAGIGLIAMRERAEILGGAVAFSRPSQGGTLVTLDVPVANAEARE
jgi:signal transduction histidine kinase